MGYEDVEVTCKYCGAGVKGNQRYMIGGRQLAGKSGRIPNWLKEKPEHQWIWNGLSDYTGGERISFDFYLCPKHNDQNHYNKAMEWAQEQIEGQKALRNLLV